MVKLQVRRANTGVNRSGPGGLEKNPVSRLSPHQAVVESVKQDENFPADVWDGDVLQPTHDPLPARSRPWHQENAETPPIGRRVDPAGRRPYRTAELSR